MRNKILIAIVLAVVITSTHFLACKKETLPEVLGNSKIELTIRLDSTSYVFAELLCELSDFPTFKVEKYGFCWDTIAKVTVEKTLNQFENLSNQNFTNTINNLLPNKEYYVKGYIQSGDVVIYSNEISFQTLDARPVVSTVDIDNVTGVSAQSGGIASTYEALFPITQRGVCWAKTENPTIKNNLTNDEGGAGSFTSILDNLDVGTTYYVRAYAINSAGDSYGEVKSFRTLDGIPELTTDSIGNVTATSATLYGNIIENDGLPILEKGFCWNITSNPDIESNKLDVAGNDLGTFHANLSNLELNTSYYVRAYIINEVDTYYGDEISFTSSNGLPILTTNTISNITAISAVGGGSITDDGGFALTSRGICWSTSPSPTTEDSKTIDGPGLGNFTSNLTDLDVSTTYYVRAYATNATGTAYGKEYSFTTKDGVPVLTTAPVTNIDATSAQSGGNITDDGGLEVTARGVCWSTSSNPTTEDNKTIDGSGGGSFTSSLTGLDVSATYYVRVYAANAIGTVYGEEYSFTTKNGLPIVTTYDLTNISTTSAQCGGSVNSDGGFSILDRGVCWSTSPNPTTEDNKTIDGSGVGSFVSNITGLTSNTTYFVRAYARNDNGISYGEEYSFTTEKVFSLPVVTTNSVSNVDLSSAICGGSVLEDGNSTVIAKGFCWSKLSEPTVYDSKTNEGSGIGDFTSNISGLDPGTTYYVRAYAENSIGIAYGNIETFTTLEESSGTFTDTRDGKVYGWIKIGTDIWMSENLNYSMSGAIGVSPVDIYGLLYTYDAAVSACPAGWSLPSRGDRDRLIENLGGFNVAGGKMKTIGTSYWNSPNTGATNESGFSALPAGAYTSTIIERGQYANFWVNYVYSDGTASYFHMSYNNESVYNHAYEKNTMISVRCVKD